MIQIMLEVAVLKIQMSQELAALTQSHVMVREPAAVVTAVYVHATVDLQGSVATLPAVLEAVEKYAVAMETVTRALLWNVIVKPDSMEMTVPLLLLFPLHVTVRELVEPMECANVIQ